VLERGERKRPYPHTVRSLADALDLSDHERASLFAAVPKRGIAASAAPATSSEPDLPVPSTPLLGRERELGEIKDFLRQVRLLTHSRSGVAKRACALVGGAGGGGVLSTGNVRWPGILERRLARDPHVAARWRERDGKPLPSEAYAPTCG
jgi:hypothetical protein